MNRLFGMFDTSPEGIRELVAQGESEVVEIKRRLPSDSVLSVVLTSFANAEGGILLIGVDEEQGVVGVPGFEAQDVLHHLQRVVEKLLPIPTEVNAVLIDNKWVPYVVVKPAPSHLRPVRTVEGTVFVRKGAQAQQKTFDESAPPIPPPGTEECVVFVAMFFREAEDPSLVDYFQAIRRAAERTGLPIAIKRIDELEGDYEISQKILDLIDEADVALADFTLSPHNVYFELGYARGKGKVVIQVARQDTSLEFDVRNWRTGFYKNATDLEELCLRALVAAYQQVAGTTTKEDLRS